MIWWEGSGSSVQAGYSPEALEKVRRRVIDGLLALPKVGMGVGGLLLGTREEGWQGEASRVAILDSVEIPCSHAAGPAFVLTPEEIAGAAETSRSHGDDVVGIYVGKPRSGGGLTPQDAELFDRLCPGAGKLAVVMVPSMVRPTRLSVYVRDVGGQVSLFVDKDLPVWTPGPETQAADDAFADLALEMAPAAKPETAPAPPAFEEEPLIAPPKPAPLPMNDVARPRSVQRPADAPPPLPPRDQAAILAYSPTFGYVEPKSGGGMKIGLAILGVALLLGALAGAWIAWGRDYFLPRPPLKLDVAESSGHIFIRWNAEAVAGLDEGALLINDGGKLMTIPLDGAALGRGAFGFERASERVTATLRIGDKREYASFEAPPPKPAPDPAPEAEESPAKTPPAPKNTPKFP